MLSDCLTKEAKSDYLRHVMSTGKWSILKEGAALQRKLSERQDLYSICFSSLTLFDQDKVWSVQRG